MTDIPPLLKAALQLRAETDLSRLFLPVMDDTNRPPLSPAAQAVRDAVLATYADNIPKDDNLWALERASTVAALRAAADQVEHHWDGMECVDRLQAIAAELEAHHE